jgi:AraC-like DNA-binding protein
MILSRKFPDLPPKPETPQNAEFRRNFFARWGQENTVFCAAATRAEYAPLCGALSVKCIQNGAARLTIEGRGVGLDDDHFIIVNRGESYGSYFDSPRPVTAFSIFFRPGLAEEVAAGVETPLAGALERGTEPGHATVEFSSHLRAHNPSVAPLLNEIQQEMLAGQIDGDWYEEKFQHLLTRLLDLEGRWRQRADLIDAAKRSTREELLRRIAWATDFINSSYADPIALDDIAHAARLSKFHLARLFARVVGVTPHAYLQRKRTQVARRLLDHTNLDVGDIAAAAGFGSRWTMYRFLRKAYGRGGRALRDEERWAAG